MDNRVVFRLLVELILIGNFATAYDNIALRKFAWQQYPYTGRPLNFARAYKAVDGLYSNRSVFGGQCTISGNAERTATWTVDLGRILSIHHITIYFRTDDIPWDENNAYTERLLGFSVYISNTSDKFDGYLCFKDTKYTKTTVPNTTTIECINHGQYVIYYNERLPGVTYPVGYSHFAYSDLCELEIYGCPTTGVYGENCTLPCSQSCQERHCNILDGACLGCLTGYKGPRCEEQCDNYKYGFECTFTCGNCSNGEQCHHVNGRCTNGCDVGAQGYTCDEACPFGRQGKNCVEVCKPNCRGGCNRFTGVCQSGCYPGWKGTFCEDECDELYYGAHCSTSCGFCLNSEQCHHINGTCFEGCDRGFQGEKCTEACPEGLFGYNCQETCDINCGVPGRCNRVTGQCEGGCQPGWKDTKCDQKCDGGTFGQNCTQPCGVCFGKEQCHFINGTCLNGCDKGYQGIKCTQACPDGRYGYNCQETCSMNCKRSTTCDVISGQCSVIGQPSEYDTDSQCYPSLYGVVTTLCLSIALNIFFVICFIRNRACKGQSQEKKNTKQLSTEHTPYNTELYDKVEDNACYQELGQISQLSHYDKLH
ncbi:multiple epidermal growth factor-like domains protein 10 [Saccostrea echinata]|uniref:multiple epidermal growth factor-like domains protein 10 n=1 Tax=Saccostrea echinata TaxID=191078 RepID=UPI002A800D54|nr:multiple epidermal growth factor-like domains protein 10 [Saccostrea echinata]